MTAILALIIVILDQLTKFIVAAYSVKLPVDIIRGIFSINLVRNTGAAFGILQNQTVFFIIISVIAIAVITVITLRECYIPAMVKVALSLILGGAIGNLIDRIRFGYVIDFLDFKIWPVFNIADSAITAGTVLLLFQMLLLKLKSKNKKLKTHIKNQKYF